MADLKIDSLQLEIESDSSSAEKSLDRLTTSLMGLNTSLKKIGNNAGNLRKIFTSMSNLSSLRMPDFSATYTQLRNISGLSFDNFNASKIKGVSDAFRELDADRLSQISNSINLMAQAFTNMNSVNIKDNGINTFVEAIKGFRDVKLPTDQFAPFVQVIGDFAALDMSNYNSKIGDFTSALARLAKTDVKMTSTDVETLINSISKVATIDFSTYNKDITNFVNALARLANVNYEKQEGGLMNYISAMRDFATLDTSNFNTGVTSFVNALKGLANADLSKYTSRLQSFLVVMKNLVSADISPYTSQLTDFVKQITKLATADGLSENTAETLRSIGNAISEFVANVSTINISDNLANTVSGLAQLVGESQNVEQALSKSSQEMVLFEFRGKSLVNAVKAIRDAFRTIDNTIRKFATSTMSALKSAVKKISELTKHKPNVDGLNISFKNLLTTVLGFKGLSGVFNWLKESVSLGAEITEIDHIVESVFGRDMTNYVNDWADNAIEKFGIAANSAKKYAGTLTAMFQASNVTGRDSAKMALDLVELAGDLSAFYNIDTATAYKKIQSGMAGMVRPLRDLGIDLSVATLKEYAQAKGIEKKYTEMTQAEKVMLRYQYLMENTSNIQSDFQRTSLSLANQLRVLKAYAQSLSTEFGAGLAAALRHVVIGLNQIMKYAVKAAQAFRYLMETIFGKYKGGASGMAFDASMMEDSSDYAGDLADSTGDASDALSDADKNAKDLKKDLSVLPFDELNQLSKKTSKDKDGDTGLISGLGGYGEDLLSSLALDEAEREMSDFEKFVKRWADSIKIYFKAHDWEMLGKAIAQGLNKGIKSIHNLLNPDDIAEKINPWIDAFTRTFNSLVDNLNFHELGATIGDGINILVDAANRVLDPKTGINWENLGKKLAEGANGLVSQIDWDDLGEFFANKINFPWQIAEGFVTDFKWKTLGASLAEGANAFVDQIDFDSMVDTVSKGLNGITDAVTEFLDGFDAVAFGTKLGDAFHRMISNVSWENIGEALANLWNEAWEFLKGFVMSLGQDEGGLSVQDAIDEKLAMKNGTKLKSTKKIGTGLGKAIHDAIKGALANIQVDDMTDTISTLFNKVFQDFVEVFGDSASWYELGHKIGEAISGIVKKTDAKGAADAVNALAHGFIELIKGGIDAIWADREEIGNKFAEFFKNVDWLAVFTIVAGVMGAAFVTKLPAIFAGWVAKATLKRTIKTAVKGALSEAGSSDEVISAGESVFGGIKSGLGKLKDSLSTGLKTALGGAKDAVGNLTTALGNLKTTLSSGWNSAVNSATSALGGFKEFLGAAGTAVGAAGFIAVVVEAAKGVQNLMDSLRGGNGMSTNGGFAIQNYIARLLEMRTISEETEQKLWNLKETWENGEIDDSSFFAQFGQILGESGVNAETAKTRLSELMGQLNLTDEQIGYIEQAIAGLSGTAEESETKLSNLGVSGKEGIGKIRDAINSLDQGVNGLDRGKVESLLNAFDEGGANAEEKLKAVINMLDVLGIDVGTVRTAIDSKLGVGTFDSLITTTSDASTKVNGYIGSMKTTTNETADALDGLSEKAQKIPTEIMTGVTHTQGMPTAIIEKMSGEMLAKMTPKGKGSGSAFEDKGEDVPEDAAKGVESKASVATDSVKDLAEDMNDKFADTLNGNPSALFSGTAEAIPMGVVDGITKKQYEVESAVQMMCDAISNQFDSLMPSVENKAEGYGDSIATKLEDAFNNKADQIDFSSKITSMFSSVWSELDSIKRDFKDYGRDIAQALVDGMQNVKFPTLEYYNSGTTPYMLPNNGGYVYLPKYSARWNWYRKGALFTDASIVGIGEAGDEAALPLEDKRAMSKIANAITSNMNGVGIDERTLTNAFINAIMATSSNTQQEPTFNITVKTMNDEVLARAVQRGNRSLNYRSSPGYAGAN